MKKIICFMLVLCLIISLLCCCSSKNNANQVTEKSQIELVDEQLQGTWIAGEGTSYVEKYSFSDGNYVCETYVNGEKLENDTIGSYVVGTDAIHTLTSDQENNVEGSIPYTFENEVLSLFPQNGATMYKDK